MIPILERIKYPLTCVSCGAPGVRIIKLGRALYPTTRLPIICNLPFHWFFSLKEILESYVAETVTEYGIPGSQVDDGRLVAAAVVSISGQSGQWRPRERSYSCSLSWLALPMGRDGLLRSDWLFLSILYDQCRRTRTMVEAIGCQDAPHHHQEDAAGNQIWAGTLDSFHFQGERLPSSTLTREMR